ncbi:MAG: hypothetical protein M3Y87_16655 [Myxococcota bacterium]|nr:hypothetical protein [Myxococcota bacterium]
MGDDDDRVRHGNERNVLSRDAVEGAELRDLIVRDEVTRAVVFFFHQQAEYDFVMDDLDYGDLDAPCWEYLELTDRDELIERGCLAPIFAMASYEAGNVGVAFSGEQSSVCRTALTAYSPRDPELARLRDIALGALALAATPRQTRDVAQVTALAWDGECMHRASVRRYFETHSRRLASRDDE